MSEAVPAEQRILGESVERLRATRTSVKWRLHDPDVLPVWVAEMDARPCPAIVEATTAAIARGDLGYGWTPPYAEAAAAYAERQWGWSFDPARASGVADVMVGVAAVLREVTDVGGPVVISPPVYNAFFGFLDHLGRRPVAAPLRPDGRLDIDALERAFASVSGQRAAYLLCNPHNPTGSVPTPDELAAVSRLAAEHEVVVVADEVHAPLVHPGHTFTPYLTVPGAENAVSVLSASKAWNVAALKTALVIPGPRCEVVLHEVLWHAVSHLGEIGQVAAFEDGRPWLAQVLDEIVGNLDLLRSLLAEHLPQVRFVQPQSTFFAWLDCRELTDDPAGLFLREGRVALTAGEEYGGEPGFARLNVATSPEVLEEAVRRMTAAAATLAR